MEEVGGWVAAALGFFSPLALGAFFALGVFATGATAGAGAASSAMIVVVDFQKTN
jgi:hypothetical protein